MSVVRITEKGTAQFVPFCRDCRFAKPAGLPFFGDDRWAFAICSVDHSPQTRDLTSGAPIKRSNYCSVSRQGYTKKCCGPTGKYFAPWRPRFPWLAKIFGRWR